MALTPQFANQPFKKTIHGQHCRRQEIPLWEVTMGNLENMRGPWTSPNKYVYLSFRDGEPYILAGVATALANEVIAGATVNGRSFTVVVSWS